MPACWSEPTAKHAFVLSWISLVVTLVAAITGIGIWIGTGSALVLVFGLENCVDLLSSLVVLWRFYCPSKLDEETEKHLRRREKRASMAISLVLGLLGVGIIGAAISDILRGQEEVEDYKIVIGISFISIIIFGALAIFKFHYSIALQSASLYKDGICSLIGATLSGALFVNTIIIDHAPGAWWIDPAVALACGVVSLIIGLQALVVAGCQGIPVWSLRWWMLSQGDGTDEVMGRELGPEDLDPKAESDEKVEMSDVV